MPINKYGLDMFITQNANGVYSILEAKSGLLITNASTKNELMKKLKDIVDRYGIEKINQMIQDSIDKIGIGISPKYKYVV